MAASRGQRRILNQSGLLFLSLVAGGPWLWAQALPVEVLGYADTVLYNGHVLTMDRDKPPFTVATALALRDGKVLATGSDDRIVKMAGPATARIDLQGRAVMPGVIDTHVHPQDYARNHHARDLTPPYVKFLRDNGIRLVTIRWDTREQALEDIKKIADGLPPGEWIYSPTGAIRQTVYQRFKDITREDLDKVAPNNPFFARSGSAIWGLVNTRMMDLVKQLYGERLVPGFIKDERGVPNGQLFGSAGEIIELEIVPQTPPHIAGPVLKKEMEEWPPLGVTTMSTRLKGGEISAFAHLDRTGQLPLRLAYTHEIGRANPLLERDLKRFGNLQGHGTDRMWLIGISIGNPDGDGPAPPPAAGGEVCTTVPKKVVHPNDFWPEGECFWDLPDDPGRAAAPIVNRYGYRVAGVHNFGDKASLMNLDAYEEANQQSSIAGKRFALDHGMMVSQDVIRRSAQLGIMWSLQPPQFYGRYASGIAEVYGEEIAQRWVLPVKSMLDAGIKIAYGSDRHDEPDRHPMFNLQVLLTRKIRDGRVYGLREKIDRASALLMMTRWGAEYVLREKEIGSLEPGKLADLVVLDRNPLDSSVADESLGQIKVLATLIGGKVVYGSLNFPAAEAAPGAR